MSYLFDCYAGVYDRFMAWARLDCCDCVLAEIGQKHGRILDVGGGTGTLANRLVGMGKRVVVLDPSVPMTRIAKKKNPNIRIVNQSLPDFRCKGKFDCIIFKDCLHHIRDQKRALERCSELLSPEGVLLIQEFWTKRWTGRLLLLFERLCFERITPVDSKRLRRLLKMEGFVCELKPVSKREYLMIGRRKKCPI